MQHHIRRHAIASPKPKPRRAPLAAALTLPLVLAAASALQLCGAELVAVYGVTRHGARNVLPKNATLGEDESSGGPTLLPSGAAASRATGGSCFGCELWW